MRNTAILLLTLVLTACATSPTPLSQAQPVDPSRVLANMTPGKDLVPVTFVRDQGFTGSACNTRILVNGTLSALIAPGEYVTLHLKPGKTILGAGSNCWGAGTTEYGTTIGRDEFSKFRVSLDGNGVLSLAPTAY